MTRPFALLLLVLLTLPASAVTLAPLFQDGAILQREKPVPVWGQAEAGEKITVTFHGQTKSTTGTAEGRWSVTLDALEASEKGEDLVVTGATTLQVHDVLVGEVWLCSGQSNMALPVLRASNFAAERVAATDPLIRQFFVKLNASATPEATLAGSWVSCSPLTVRSFTAAGYFFARELRKSLGVPVGIIDSSFGGSPIESWIPEANLKGDPVFAVVYERYQKLVEGFPARQKAYEAAKAKADAQPGGQPPGRKPRALHPPDGPVSRQMPSGLYNAMIHPLIPYAVRGILWYQGEANGDRPTEYGKLFRTMITQWRQDFAQGDLPFYFVQLPGLIRKNQDWAFQREAQASALTLPQTGMVVTLDIGEAKNLHPTDKQDVGKRLALIAQAQVYAKGGVDSGPVFQSAAVDGSAVVVTFAHAEGLKFAEAVPAGSDKPAPLTDPAAAPAKIKPVTPSSSLELAGKDKVFHPATAQVDGTLLRVTSTPVPEPVYIRYAWSTCPSATVFNGAGLPAAPFRTDDLPAPSAPGVPVAEPTAEENGK